jgi:hypothetical protein
LGVVGLRDRVWLFAALRNQVLAKLNGQLLPFGWMRALRERRRTTRFA